MKIVCISDTHGKHRELGKLPKGDLLIYAGDIMDSGLDTETIIDFSEWLAEQPIPNKVIIAGNHDRWFELAPAAARRMLTEVTYLENSSIQIGGLKFWGSPQQPEFLDWAFNVRRGEEIRCYWKRIPTDVDVLITHGPPMGVLDQVIPGKSYHLGCEELAKRVDRLPNLKLHVFGHIHGGYGTYYSVAERCLFINASSVNQDYQVVNKPVVVEIPDGSGMKGEWIAIDPDVPKTDLE